MNTDSSSTPAATATEGVLTVPVTKPKLAKAAKPAKAAKAPTAAPLVVDADAAPAKAAKAEKLAKLEKAAKPAKPAPAADKPLRAKAPHKEAAKDTAKDKLVRDSFTMPAADFALLGKLKERALGFQRPTKKSELLRAGLRALLALSQPAFQALLSDLPEIKTGRPRKTA